MRSVLIPIAFLVTVAAVPFAFAQKGVQQRLVEVDQYPPPPPPPTPTPTPTPLPTPTPFPTPTPTPTPLPTPTPFPFAPPNAVWDAGIR